MALTISRIDRKRRDYTITATDPNGSPVIPAAVSVALLPPRTTPTADTTWSTATYSNGVATVLLAGPDADDTDALAVPAGGADLWVKVTDTPEIDAEKVERISVQ